MKRSSSRDSEGWLHQYDGRIVRRIRDMGQSPTYHQMAINLKGTNGSGKSTVPMQMIANDQSWTFLTMSKDDVKPVGVYCHKFKTAIIGTYLTNCGGCDSLGNTQVVKEVLKHLWRRDCHILYEGVIVGDIRETFYRIMLDFRAIHGRELGFCFMGTRLKECLRRIQARNGGKPINEEMVRQKYQNSAKHLQAYLDEGLVPCTVLDTTGTKQEVFQKFLELYPELKGLF